MSGSSFLRAAHKSIYGADIGSSNGFGSSGSYRSTPSSFNSFGSSNTKSPESESEWWHWVIIVGILLAVIGSCISSCVGAYFLVRNNQKKKMQMQNQDGTGSRPNNQIPNGSKINEAGSKENEKKKM